MFSQAPTCHTCYFLPNLRQINTYFQSIWEINLFWIPCRHFSPTWTKLQLARCGGGNAHSLPCWMAPPSPKFVYHQRPTPIDINSPFYSCHNSTAEIVASCFHLIDPLSRCWIWSNHSQSSLNISFFKQNRGSKFHHSMTRSVADNTIKPIPAYPEGAISGGTAGRWDYRPTERCQSPLIHSPLCAAPILQSIKLWKKTVL